MRKFRLLRRLYRESKVTSIGLLGALFPTLILGNQRLQQDLRTATFPPMAITDFNSYYRATAAHFPESIKQIVRLGTADFVHISVDATLLEIVSSCDGWRMDGIVTANIEYNVTDHL